LELNDRGIGVRFSTGERYSLLRNIQNGPETRDAFPGVGQLKRETGHSPASTYGFKNMGTYTSNSTYAFLEGSGTNLVLPFVAVGGTPVYGLLVMMCQDETYIFIVVTMLIIRHAGILVYNILLRIMY
jgi:hypothetical protein